MSEGVQAEVGQERPTTFGDNGQGEPRGIATVEDLADKTRFHFREKVLEIPELDTKIVLRSLSVREREMLPQQAELAETDDEGKRTAEAIKAAAQTFEIIVAEPKVTREEAERFLGDWPVEAFDRVVSAYGDLIGTEGEDKAAYAEFPEG